MLSAEARFQMQKDRIRKGLLKYTRKAFRALPQLDKPRILDVGCGSGVPTLELARLSNGKIIGLDVDQDLLDVLRSKIEKAGVSDRVKAIECSVFDMEFPDESFDIIWSEGSIGAFGFKKGLQEWKRFLKPIGFMVIHDEKSDIEEKLKQISSCGYELLDHFILDADIWWAEYFAPLEKLIGQTRTRYADDREVLESLRNTQRQINQFKKNPEMNSSAFFVIKRN
jgi:ubiquinone/menaquinone biosynthesis C-methylase UbiE